MKYILTIFLTLLTSLSFAIELNEKVNSDPLLISVTGGCMKRIYDQYTLTNTQVTSIQFYSRKTKDTKDCIQTPIINFTNKGVVTIFNSRGAMLNTYEVDFSFERMHALASKLNSEANTILFKVDRSTLRIISVEANFDSLD